MVAAPCRAFSAAARWKGHAPHTMTGVASVRLNHCQFGNCSAGTIASTRTGTVSSVETTSRVRSAAVAASPSAALGASGRPATSDGSATGAGGGRVAVYPVACTVSIADATLVPSGSTTCAFSVA